ncbi:hypothetical protein SK128_024456, partial [Halocaridina rubra]
MAVGATYQLVEMTLGGGILCSCNVYFAPGRLNTVTHPPPRASGMLYMSDFNTRHPVQGDLSGTVNHSEIRLSCITQYQLQLPTLSLHPLSIPLKYCLMYISFISAFIPNFHCGSPEQLYSSIVRSTHDFFNQYVCRSNIKRQTRHHTWPLDRCTMEAERRAVEASLVCQKSPTLETLCQYQMSTDALVALQQFAHSDTWHKFTNIINHQMNMASIWYLINTVVRKKLSAALHHSRAQYAQDLPDTWSDQYSVSNLPAHVQEALSSQKMHHTLLLSVSLLGLDVEDVPITKGELHHALASGKATAPGDDGITYSVLRFFLKVPDDPLLQLCNLCLQYGYKPQARMTSLFAPIPKPGTNKFRQTSLKSCFNKEVGRISSTASCSRSKTTFHRDFMVFCHNAACNTASLSCKPASPPPMLWSFFIYK